MTILPGLWDTNPLVRLPRLSEESGIKYKLWLLRRQRRRKRAQDLLEMPKAQIPRFGRMTRRMLSGFEIMDDLCMSD